VLAVCLATGFTTLLDQAVLNVAVPALRADLGADRAQVQWILAAYSLTFGIALVPAGRLGDAYGRAPLLVGGLALFSAASVLGATASAPWVLVAARLLQGIGAGTANPQVIGLLQDHFAGPARTRALGAYATVGGVSAVVGPLVGGVVLALAGSADGWRVVVALNIPFGVLTCWFAVRALRPRWVRSERRARIDGPGIALLTVLVLCGLLPVVGVGSSGVGLAGWAVLAVVVVAALAWWERRTARSGGVPILLPALGRSRGFVLGTVVALCGFGAGLGSSLLITLFLQEGLGLSPLVAGLCTLPSAIGMAVASTFAWRVVDRWGRRSVTLMLAVGTLVVLGTIAAVDLLPAAALIAALAVSQLLTGVANGLVIAPNQGLALAFAPPGAAGLAAGFFQVSQRISATLALAACSGVFVATATPGNSTGYRGGVATGLGIALALMLVATVASAADRGDRP
jgi:MFS family permease